MSTAFPFLQGAKGAAEQANKTSRLIYGRKRLNNLAKISSTTNTVGSINPQLEKPTLVSLLLHAPARKFPELFRNAVLAGELNTHHERVNTLNVMLKQFKQFKRYDKALACCRAFEKETSQSILPRHFVTLMSIALNSSSQMEENNSTTGNSEGWVEALRLFHAGFVKRKDRNPITSPAVGAAITALNAGGHWNKSVKLFKHSLLEDKIPLDPVAVHSLIFHLRTSAGRWDLAMQAFDLAAKNGTRPNYSLYRELFNSIHDSAVASPVNALTAWEFALSAASAIDKICPLNAGIYNSLITTCAVPAPIKGSYDYAKIMGKHAQQQQETDESNNSKNNKKWIQTKRAPNWEAGLHVLQHLQDKVILSAIKDNSARTIINTGTISALCSLRPTDAEHQIKCIELARQHGLPIMEKVYHNLLRSLDVKRRSSEGLAFCQKMLDEGINDPSNLGLSPTPLLNAMVDSLSTHPESEIALLTARHFHSSLLPVISSSTAGCGTWGDESQAWIVEANTKVAVITSDVLEMFSDGHVVDVLMAKFDAIMVPFSAVRVVLKKLENESSHSPNAEKLSRALHLLRRLQVMENPNKEGTGFVQVLPFIHHLKALGYLDSCCPYTDYYVSKKKRKNAEFVEIDSGNEDSSTIMKQLPLHHQNNVDESKTDQKKKLKSMKFMSASSSERNDEKITIATTEDEMINNKNLVVNSPSNINHHDDDQDTKNNQKNLPHLQQPPWYNGNPKFFVPERDFKSPSAYEWSHATATSLMLSRLNPDANVVVVTKDFRDMEYRCCWFYSVKRVGYAALQYDSPLRPWLNPQKVMRRSKRKMKKGQEKSKMMIARNLKMKVENSKHEVVADEAEEEQEGKGTEKK